MKIADGWDIEDDNEQDDIESSYIHYEIASYPSDLTLNVIKEMWDEESIIIPKFQRKYVWTKKQASLLIDSFLCGLPVPPVFLYIDNENKNIVIDGQQRILSIVYFLNGYFGDEDNSSRRQIFRLDLPNGSPYKDKKFDELSERDKRKLRYSSILRAINIKQLDPKDDGSSSFYIFQRLNTGGTPLTPQEIRNCVYRGEFADALQEINKNEDWRLIVGKKEADKHQKDIELLLRIFAFSYEYDDYEKPTKFFLNKVMCKHRNGKTHAVREFVNVFPEVSKNITSVLGKKPFHIRGPLNTSTMDSVMSLMIIHKQHPIGDLYNKYNKLKEDKDFIKLTSVATTDSKVIDNRREIVKNLLW